MFSVIFSNRCEHLLEALLARLDAERRGPFARRQVVAPGSALRRRIELAAADREGVCAGIDFDHLAQWLWRQAGHVVDLPARAPYAPPALAWRIFAALDAPWVNEHARLAHYLRGADARMRFDLSGRLAHLFDHYLCYRPDWLERWAAGGRALPAESAASHDDEDWQAALWRRIHGGEGGGGSDENALSPPFMRFLRQAARMDDAALAAALPPAVHIFGLPALPPLYLEILRTLARAMDVHLYVLNPCREYWFDIVDARRLSWLSKRQQDLFFETGNKLLAAWGKQAQVHIESLFEGERPMREEAAFAPHPARHVLAKLQNAILDLRELEAGSIRLDDNDRSIELHICHSRTRELEALHDRLLGLFSAPRPPRPDEIVVLTPDLAACAPLIEAVFGAAPRERHIPWRIAGSSAAEGNPAARILDWLLTLAAGRAPASRVFDLLQQPLVAAHFGLGEAGLEQVRIWMESAGIRWGLDAEHAREAGGGGHTMEKGLARLFLSWAAGEAASRALFAGHTGTAYAPRGGGGLALGAFWRYAGTLRRLRAELLKPREAEGWRTLLMGALAALAGEAPEHAEEMRGARETINALAEDMKAGFGPGCAAMIPLDVVHPALAARFSESVHGGAPGGAVTFGALPSLRGLPYRVVCVIGLDHDAFPGREHSDEFDLMTLHPRKGDRQRRIDERNLFLDVLLAARDVLHLSCVGRSARDNTALPPSPLVDELLDALAAACAEDPEQPASLARARARLTVPHPLQAFSPGYFTPDKEDKRLENFRSELAAALAARQRSARERAAATAEAIMPRREDDEDERRDAGDGGGGDSPFFTAPLPPPDERWRHVDLAQLKRFFANPCRFLLRERLGLDLFAAQDELADIETFVPDWQARDALAKRLLPVLLAGKDMGADGSGNGAAEDGGDGGLLALARAGGEYPAGNLGDSALRRELAALRAFADRLNAARMRPCLPARLVKLDFDLGGESWSLQTVFNDLRADGLVRHRYDKARARDYLAAWIDHLTLCAASPDGVECRSVGLSRDESFTLRPLPSATARQHLAGLLELYRDGLREPLRFFPKSAWEYARRAAPDNDNDTARAEAARIWAGGDFPERDDFAYRLALRGADEALDDKFWNNAETVFGALRASLDDSRPARHPG
ncbi:MAG: exodeoxyribonuclease V subunit gamma [Azoarcus sp.]|jgi:exodeoxyribonuclease V gamma subunit|nr:exodeoxyribonuclease V subunit gamma [Azoarcus sp.]